MSDKSFTSFKQLLFSKNVGCYLLVFIAALAARIFFAIYDNHSILFNALDASEYIRNAQEIQSFTAGKPISFWLESLQALTGSLPDQQLSQLNASYKPVSDVVNRSGPVYPLFLFLCFTITGASITVGNLVIPVVFQCILTSLACVFITYTGFKLWDLRAGTLSGLLAAFYPGLIVNSARLISEPLATFFICLIMALTTSLVSQRDFRSLKAYCLGLASVALQLTRSALVLVTAVIGAAGLFLFKNREARLPFGLLILGMATGLSMFAAIQFLGTGHGSIMADRLSSYNLFVGVDLTSDGWLAYPFSNFAFMYELTHYEIILQSLNQNPLKFIEIIANKIPRLFAYPWNDFKASIGIFTPWTQVLFHQICLCLATVGLCLSSGATTDKNRFPGVKALFVVIFLAHTAYIFFESQPRYALTSMPFILLFAGFGLANLVSSIICVSTRTTTIYLATSISCLFLLSKSNVIPLLMQTGLFSSFSASAAVVIVVKLILSVAGFFLIYKLAVYLKASTKQLKFTSCITALALTPFIVFPMSAYKRINQWSNSFNNKAIRQNIPISKSLASQIHARQFFVLVDGHNWSALGQDATLSINGLGLNCSPLPLMPLVQDLGKPIVKANGAVSYDLEMVLSSMLLAAGGTNLDLRQWFVVPVESAVLEQAVNQNSKNIAIEFKNSSAANAKIYGSYILKKEQLTMPSIARYSWDKAFYSIENDCGFSDLRLQEKFFVKGLVNEKVDLSPQAGKQTGSLNMRLLSVPKDKSGSRQFSPNKIRVKTKSALNEKIMIDDIPDASQEELWLATVEGEIDSGVERQIILPYSVIIDFYGSMDSGNQTKRRYICPWAPSSLSLKNGTNKFKFSFLIKPKAIGDKLSSIEVSFNYGGRADSNQFFSVHKRNQLEKTQLDKLVKNKIHWKKLDLNLKSWHVKPLTESYQVF